jgi:hypothetical protein
MQFTLSQIFGKNYNPKEAKVVRKPSMDKGMLTRLLGHTNVHNRIVERQKEKGVIGKLEELLEGGPTSRNSKAQRRNDKKRERNLDKREEAMRDRVYPERGELEENNEEEKGDFSEEEEERDFGPRRPASLMKQAVNPLTVTSTKPSPNLQP